MFENPALQVWERSQLYVPTNENYRLIQISVSNRGNPESMRKARQILQRAIDYLEDNYNVLAQGLEDEMASQLWHNLRFVVKQKLDQLKTMRDRLTVRNTKQLRSLQNGIKLSLRGLENHLANNERDVDHVIWLARSVDLLIKNLRVRKLVQDRPKSVDMDDYEKMKRLLQILREQLEPHLSHMPDSFSPPELGG